MEAGKSEEFRVTPYILEEINPSKFLKTLRNVRVARQLSLLRPPGGERAIVEDARMRFDTPVRDDRCRTIELSFRQTCALPQ